MSTSHNNSVAILLAHHGNFKFGTVLLRVGNPVFITNCFWGLVHWLQAVILCLMNFDYCFMKRTLCALIFVTVLTTSSSSAQELPPQPAAETGSVQVESDALENPPDEPLPTDPDVMFHVFSAETLGAAGDFSGAASEYLKAALISEDPEIAERAAGVAVSAGEWQMATLASGRWAMLAPESLDARELAAASRLREGDYVGAEYQLARILELTTSDPAHGWRIITSLLAPVNDKVRANKVLDNLQKDFDAESDANALYARSQITARFGDLNKSTQLVDRAILLKPDEADLYAWAGRLAVNNGNASLALKRYRQGWKLDPENSQIAMAYAELLKRNNDLSTAQKVLAKLPDKPDMRFARLVFALDAGERGDAERLYKGFSKAKYESGSDSAYFAAQSAELLDYKQEAISWYEQVTGERSLRSTIRRAYLLADLGNVEEARNILAQLRVQVDVGTQVQSFLAEAQILQTAGLEEDAMQILDDALATHPDVISLRYSRALVAVALGRLELAESDLRQIISVQPGNSAAINALGYTLADLTDRYDEAEKLILRAYELAPDDPSIIDSMGWISYRLGRLPEAEKYLRRAWKEMRNAEIAAHLGEVLWSRGQKDEARSLWKLGMEMEGSNEVLINTMQRFGESP
jgi:tetratricopeptide (TPR) repeat protein